MMVLLILLVLQAQAQEPAWKTYYDSAQAFWGKDWPKTVLLLKQAEKFAANDLGIYDPNYLTIANDLGLAYWQTKAYVAAERLLKETLSTKRQVYAPSDPEISRAVSNLAGLYAEQGDLVRSGQLYRQIISTPRTEVEHDVYWKAVKNMIRLHETQEDMDSALQLVDKLDAIAIERNDPAQGYETRLTRGRINRKLRKYDAARTILETLIKELQQQRDPLLSSLHIQALQEAGLLYLSTGSFNQAEKNILQGFRLIKTLQLADTGLQTEVLNNLASVYEKLNIYDKATAYYQEALDLCQRTEGQHSLYCITLQSNIAGIQLKQGDIKQAISSFERIQSDLSGLVPESNPFYITVLNNLASAYRKDGQYQKASGHLDQAYTLIVRYKLGNDDLAATVMNNMAVLLTAQGKFQEAIGYYQRAYETRRATYGDESVLLMDLSSNMAVVYWALQQPEKALPLFQKSVALAIRQIRYIFPNLSEDEQVQFYKKLKEDLERFNTIAFQSSGKKPELLTQVFNNQIIIKSLIFFTQQKRTALIEGQPDSVLIKQYNLLKEKRNQLGHLYQLSRRELSAAGITVKQLEDEIDALEKTISLKTSETVAEKMQSSGVTWQDIQSRMQPDDALIELIRFRKYDFKTYQEDLAGRVNFGFTDSVHYAALITTRETTMHPKLVLMKHGTNMENRLATYYKNALRFSVDDEYSYESYWKALEPSVQEKRKIYFSGDGIYHKVNLNTLRDPQSGKFLIERYEIHYLLNAAQYVEERKKDFSNHRAVLIGDPVFDVRQSPSGSRYDSEKYSPLPGTYAEVVKINEILKSRQWTSEVYVKKAATERNLSNAASPGILHIATHGFFLPDVVTVGAKVRKDFLFHSGLILSGAAENPGEGIDAYQGDGIVTAYDVMNLDLSATDLVVLSACETALGKIENGEGVYGLQRSFLQAGARNIMISLWKVDDQYTQELMVKFYQYLFEGKSKRDALKAAQLDLLHTVRDPLYWGAFIMVGVD